MSDRKYNSFDEDVLANLEKLKAKYSDFGSDYEDDDDFSSYAAEKDENNFDYEDEAPEEQPKQEMRETYFKPAPAAEPEPVSAEPAEDEEQYTEEINYEEAEKNIFSEVVYTGSEAKYSKEKKTMSGKKKRSSSKILTVILSLLIALIIWGALFAIDYVLVSSNSDPFFCIKTQEYANGSEDFTGLFYKYQRHVENNGTVESKCLPWFVKGDNDKLEKLEEGEKAKEASASSDDMMPLEITIPAEFIEEDTTNGLKLTDEQKAQGFESVKLNKEDGSATYRIQKGNYRIFLAKLKNSLSVDLNSLAEDKDYPSIKKVEFTNDLSTVTLYVEKEDYLSGLDHFIDQSIFEWVGKYKSFANQVPSCELIIRDIEDNSVIQENKG